MRCEVQYLNITHACAVTYFALRLDRGKNTFAHDTWSISKHLPSSAIHSHLTSGIGLLDGSREAELALWCSDIVHSTHSNAQHSTPHTYILYRPCSVSAVSSVMRFGGGWEVLAGGSSFRTGPPRFGSAWSASNRNSNAGVSGEQYRRCGLCFANATLSTAIQLFW